MKTLASFAIKMLAFPFNSIVLDVIRTSQDIIDLKTADTWSSFQKNTTLLIFLVDEQESSQ